MIARSVKQLPVSTDLFLEVPCACVSTAEKGEIRGVHVGDNMYVSLAVVVPQQNLMHPGNRITHAYPRLARNVKMEESGLCRSMHSSECLVSALL